MSYYPEHYFPQIELTPNEEIMRAMLGGQRTPTPPIPKESKPVKKDYNTVAVKFINGGNLNKAYTYRVPKRAKLRLGQEVVVPTERDGCTTTTVAVVVELHKTPQDTGPHNYKFVAGTVKPL